MNSAEVKKKVSAFVDKAYASAVVEITTEHDENLANLREQLGLKGLSHSSVMERGRAQLRAEAITAMVRARAEATAEAYEMYGALDKEAAEIILADAGEIRAQLLGAVSGSASHQAQMISASSGSDFYAGQMQARNFATQVDQLSAPILNDIACQLERRQFLAKQSSDSPKATRTIFVSCGQFTAEEKALGKNICAIIRNEGYDPYFAENQSSLKGLHENILTQLHDCAGFIAVMHPRGIVTFPGGDKQTRGSVWIEQEIAIAAFVSQFSGRNIEVAAFIHEDIKREGIRDLLHLNPISFRDDKEIVDLLPSLLRTWKLVGSAEIELRLDSRPKKPNQCGRRTSGHVPLPIER